MKFEIEQREQGGKLIHKTKTPYPATGLGLSSQLRGDEYLVINGVSLSKEDAAAYFVTKCAYPRKDMLEYYTRFYSPQQLEEIKTKVEGEA